MIHFIYIKKNINKIIDNYGRTPLPPYIEDRSKKYKYYNNQFSDGGFSVASPTAGLHFTNNQINKLKKEGHEFIFINLDVNIDTFKPITSEYIDDHDIHEESYSIANADFDKIIQAKKNGIDIYCIGTLQGRTDYFIYPDTKLNIPNYLITNFHAPKSSLLSIVACIYGEHWPELYKYALKSGLKFLSFGDAVIFNVDE